MKRKRIATLLLSVVLLLSLVISAQAAGPGLSNFKKQAECTAFSDVPETAWYAESVKTVCEHGLMNGTGNGKFSPNGYVTMAESVALMSRLYDIYNGGDGTFEPSSPWFIAYDNYAAAHDLDSFGFSGDSDFWSDRPTRELFIDLVSQSIPMSEFQIINDVCTTEPTGNDFTDRLMRLFNAGIITGKSNGTGFDGGSTITRAEVATVLTRMIEPSSRVKGRPTYIVNTAKGVIWADKMNRPGDMASPTEDLLMWLNEDYSISAIVNGIKYDVVLDRDAAKQDPLWDELYAKYETSSTAESETTNTTTPSENCDYIINTNTGKFHYTWCKSVNKMAEKNKWYYTGTRDSVVAMGYVPCKNCNP